MTPQEQAMRESIEALVRTLERIVKRTTPHVYDDDDDRRRDLYHIDEIARIALADARKLLEEMSHER